MVDAKKKRLRMVVATPLRDEPRATDLSNNTELNRNLMNILNYVCGTGINKLNLVYRKSSYCSTNLIVILYKIAEKYVTTVHMKISLV